MRARSALVLAFVRLICFLLGASTMASAFPRTVPSMLRQFSIIRSKYTSRLQRETPFFSDPHSSVSSMSSPVLRAEEADDKASSSKIMYIDLSQYEEKEKREMEWLVETTAKVLGLEGPNRNPVGQMSKQLTRRVFKLMAAWSRRNKPHVVDLILRRLVTEIAAGNPNVQLSTRTYNLVLKAWSESNLHGAAERCETILTEMEKQYANGNLNAKPNTYSYNCVMKAFVNSDEWRRMSYPKVKALFDRLEPLKSQSQPSTSWLNRGSYNILLSSIVESEVEELHESKGEIAEKYLQAMKVQQAARVGRVHPNINSYNFVIRAWSTASNDGQYREERINQLFHEIAELGLPPTTDTFNHILAVYLKSKNPLKLEKIQEFLRKMEELYANGNVCAKPDRTTINTVVAAYAKDEMETAIGLGRDLEKKYDIGPDTVSNNILLDCWKKSGRRDAAIKAVHLLNKMERDFRKGLDHLKPDAYTYATVIDSFTKCGVEEAAKNAQSTLDRMRALYRNHGGDPANVSVYNAVINACAYSGGDSALEYALALLEDMEMEHKVDPFVPKPNTVTFNSILKVLSNRSDQGAIHADEILTKLELSQDYSPDTFSFTTVISAYGRSAIPNKAEKAYDILQRMVTAHEKGNLKKMNIHPFNAALNACAFVSGNSKAKVEAFVILVAITTQLNKLEIHSDHTTYGTILRACSTLLPPGDKRRKELVEGVFRKACREGKVGELVLKQLKFAASADQYQDLLQRNKEDNVRIEDLPPAWTINVRENKRR